MSQDPLRLRVTVQRHGIPEVKFVWPCARGAADLTVAQLLTQLNDVVPLESGEWGLEDYAVELVAPDDGSGRGYECLHFQQVQQVFKDEDQVLIRSLLGEDLKRRRLTGRHQISTDGKHLVDGLAFGRPWLRTPRDRPPMELPPRKRQRVIDYGVEEEYDDSYERPMLLLEAPEVGDDEDDDSFADVEENDDEDIDDDDDDDRENPSEDDEDMAEELELLRRDNAIVGEDPAPTTNTDTEDALTRSVLDAFSHEMEVLQAAFPLSSVSVIGAELVRQKHNIIDTYLALKRSNDPDLTLDKMLEKMLGDPLFSGLHESDQQQEEAPPARPLIQVVDSESDDSSDSEETSSSDSSDSDASDEDDSESEDDGSFEDSSSADAAGSGSESESASESDSDSDSDSESSGDNRNVVTQVRHVAPEAPANSTKGTREVVRAESAPHTGLTKTQKRNARRRKLLAHKNSLTDSPGTPDALLSDQSLMERKEQLLRALGQGSNVDAQEKTDKEGEANHVADEPQESASKTSPETRRSRVDVGAGRRLLFGALGLKAPKSKADEEKIKQGLMKDVRPLNNSRIAEDKTEPEQAAASAEDEDPDEWRNHISYSAVECCHEGVVLSEPPFPFKQRWDPQQQGRHWGKGKRKRQSQGFNEEFYDDSAVFYEDGDFAGGAKRLRPGQTFNPFGTETTTAIQGGASDKAKEAQPTSKKPEKSDDVPPLPSDLGSLPTLTAATAKEGMVVTWKQMAMSKATRWQPEIVQMTGTVQAGSDEAQLHVLLAVRDREVKDRVYDAETGKRVYDKFEVPDSDSEDEAGEDDGQRIVSWAEAMDPRILRDVPAAPLTAAVTAKKPLIQEVEVDDAEPEGETKAAEGEVADDESSDSDSDSDSDSESEDEDE